MTFFDKIKKYGLETQGAMLISELKKQNGVNVSPDEITVEMLSSCFLALGVNFSKVRGRRWYQVFSNGSEIKLLNALSLIPLPN
jgi:hypothetical protein